MPHIDSFTLEISQTSKRTIVSCASLTVSSIPRDGSTMTGGSREPSWEMRATLILDHAAQPSVYRVIDDDRFVEKDISIEAGLVSLMKFIDSFVRFFYFFFKRVWTLHADVSVVSVDKECIFFQITFIVYSWCLPGRSSIYSIELGYRLFIFLESGSMIFIIPISETNQSVFNLFAKIANDHSKNSIFSWKIFKSFDYSIFWSRRENMMKLGSLYVHRSLCILRFGRWIRLMGEILYIMLFWKSIFKERCIKRS